MAVLSWEKLQMSGLGLRIWRTQVPGGWLVHGHGSTSLVFIADVGHDWDVEIETSIEFPTGEQPTTIGDTAREVEIPAGETEPEPTEVPHRPTGPVTINLHVR